MVIDDIGYDRSWCSVDLLGFSRQTNRQRAPNSNDGSVTFVCITELGDVFKVSSRRLWYYQTIESTRHGASSCLPFITVNLRGCDSVWTDDWCLLNALPWALQRLLPLQLQLFSGAGGKTAHPRFFATQHRQWRVHAAKSSPMQCTVVPLHGMFLWCDCTYWPDHVDGRVCGQ